MDVELTIDDVQVTAPAGASVLDVARRAGRDIPALCHHEAVPAIAVLPPLSGGGAPAGPRLGAADDLVRLPRVGRPRRGHGLTAHPQAPRHEPAAAAATRAGRPGPSGARARARRDGAAVRSRHRRAAPRLHPVRAVRARVLHPRLQRARGDRSRRTTSAWVRPSARRPPWTAWAAAPATRRAPPTASRWRIPPPRARSGAAPWSSSPASAAVGRSRPKRTLRRWPPRRDLPVKSSDLCDVCKRRVTSERLASPGR